MSLPRDLSGTELAKRLAALGYATTQQAGSQIRLTTQANGEHHLTVPAHDPLKIGTLNAILREGERHHRLTRDELLSKL